MVDPQPHVLVARGEPMARPEKEKDVRGLADDELAALERNGGANGGCLMRLPSRRVIIAGMPLLPGLRATSI